MDPEQFYSILSSPEGIFYFLSGLGLLVSPDLLMCARCGSSMNRRFRKREDNEVSFLARCNKCKTDVSLLKNTFFATAKIGGVSQKLSCKTVLKLAFQYFEKKHTSK